jgi:hypothetical protein
MRDMSRMRINITTLHSANRPLFPPASAKERLERVEQLRIEAGKFLYEYPTGLQRVLTAVRRLHDKQNTPRLKDKADVEELEKEPPNTP